MFWIGGPDGKVGSVTNESGRGVTDPTGDSTALAQPLRELSDGHATGGARVRTAAHQAQAL